MPTEEMGNPDDLKVYVHGEDGEPVEICTEVQEMPPVDMGEDTPPLWFDAQPISGSFTCTVRMPLRFRIALKWRLLKNRILFKWFIYSTRQKIRFSLCRNLFGMSKAKALWTIAVADAKYAFRSLTRWWR